MKNMGKTAMKRKIKTLALLLTLVIFLLPILSCDKNFIEKNASLIDLSENSKGSVAVISTYYSSGTGFAVRKTSDALYVATNKHLFYGDSGNFEYDSLSKVTFYNGETASTEKGDAKLIGYSSYHDIAVIKINKDSEAFSKISPLDMEIKETPVVGESLFAIGNSLNYGLALFEGKVSIPCQAIYIKANSIEKTVPVMQITVPVNIGSSGSPIINFAGKVVGIGTYQIPKDENSRPVEGMNFCVPSMIADKVINQIINDNHQGLSDPKEYTSMDTQLVKIQKEKFEINFGSYGFKGILRKDHIEITEVSDNFGSLITLSERAPAVGDKIVKFGTLEIKNADLFKVFAIAESYRRLETISQASKRLVLSYTKAETGEKVDITYLNVYEKNF